VTRKEFWLKLFAENDTALASTLILVKRYVTSEQLEKGKEYIESRKKELYEEMPLSEIKLIFPNYNSTKEGGIQE